MDKQQLKSNHLERKKNSHKRIKVFKEKSDVADVTKIKKKSKGSNYRGNYAMYYKREIQGSKAVAKHVDKKWELIIQECTYVNET